MGVLAALVPQCLPAYFGGGHKSSGAENASWNWPVAITDDTGAPITLTSVTGVAKVIGTDLTTVLLSLHVTIASNIATVYVDDSETVNLVSGTEPTVARWYLTLSDGTDTVAVWSPVNSTFLIYPAGA